MGSPGRRPAWKRSLFLREERCVSCHHTHTHTQKYQNRMLAYNQFFQFIINLNSIIKKKRINKEKCIASATLNNLPMLSELSKIHQSDEHLFSEAPPRHRQDVDKCGKNTGRKARSCLCRHTVHASVPPEDSISEDATLPALRDRVMQGGRNIT